MEGVVCVHKKLDFTGIQVTVLVGIEPHGASVAGVASLTTHGNEDTRWNVTTVITAGVIHTVRRHRLDAAATVDRRRTHTNGQFTQIGAIAGPHGSQQRFHLCFRQGVAVASLQKIVGLILAAQTGAVQKHHVVPGFA